ncbi:putative disease resistance protein rga3 [Phtheirospermum japonicum]|uniref:Putative disease resistance protein rga3 n=1 Tax=Phtheirospermum japonicum TaxID=374723 RepID=A0A830BFU7_9LAMI|nr:putative disease resistance protein rga3 [Phtheirospermum japonicum]
MTRLVPCLGGGGAPSLLRELRILYCSSLRELPDDLHSLNSLEGFTSLRELEIRNCFGLTNLPIEMVESCAPSLEELILRGLISIRNMGMHSSWNNVSFNEAVDAMLPQFISLRSLELFGKEHWDSLPDQLQHLTSLQYLSLKDFGIEALPEWFGNLSSLKSLTLWNYKKLRHLPSKQAMQRLSKLTDLWIARCPLLISNEKKRSNELPQIVDFEWPKISHIPEIYVDWHRISSDRH